MRYSRLSPEFRRTRREEGEKMGKPRGARYASCVRAAVLLAALAFCALAAAQERVKGTLNLTIEQPLSADQAMAALSAALRLQGIALVESGGVVRVVPEADAKLQGGRGQSGGADGARGDELVTQVFRLNYESAANIAPVLRPL